MDQLSALIDQHRSIRKLITAGERSKSARERVRLLDQIRSEFEFHAYLEESYVYPVLEDYERLKQQIYGFWKDHEAFRAGLQNLESVHQNERLFQERLIKLAGLFEEHIREEEIHIFPEARKLIGADQLDQIERSIKKSIQEKKIAA